jgi:ankyrin repeat protein
VKADYGISPLSVACYYNHILTAKLLLEGDADIDIADRYGATPLIIASLKGNHTLIQLLLSHNARIDCKNNKNQTAHSIAVEWGHTEIVKAIDDEIKRREYNPTLHRLKNYLSKHPSSPEFIVLYKRT